MPDRTKLPRGLNVKSLPSYWETEGEGPRTDYDQNVRIPDEFANVQLEDQLPVQSVGNQQAGPKAVFLQYYPEGGDSTKREGLKDDGASRSLPKSRKYTGSPNAGKRSNPRE